MKLMKQASGQEGQGSSHNAGGLSIAERVAMHFEDGTDTLYCCPDSWAVRHRFVQQETGEIRRARCDCWRCLYCGPRKVDRWRQLIEQAKPTLHVVLTRAGKTMEQASRALTTWVQAMRRGSKGKGKGHVGARPAYPIEYIAVAERHSNFAEVGFHWHLLIVGVEYIPQEHIKECWHSATHGESYIAWVEAVKNTRAIGYVTKYLMKDITRAEKGVKLVERKRLTLVVDEQGKLVERSEVELVERESAARRIRYSRSFFGESTRVLWQRLLEQAEQEQLEEQVVQVAIGVKEVKLDEQALPSEESEIVTGSSWRLYEVAPFTTDLEVYRRRRWQAVEESVSEHVANGRRLSGRVLTLWDQQRRQLRRAG